jgi:hypothetical protein
MASNLPEQISYYCQVDQEASRRLLRRLAEISMKRLTSQDLRLLSEALQGCPDPMGNSLKGQLETLAEDREQQSYVIGER